jgi:hypothetical protein
MFRWNGRYLNSMPFQTGFAVHTVLQVLGVRRWRQLVIDREKWRGIFRQAKAHSWL